MKRQIELFTPNFQPNYRYETYSPGDRIYGVNTMQLATVIESTPKGIKALLGNGKTEVVDHHHISKVKTSGYGFKSGDRVRLSPELREFFNVSEDFLGTIKEFFGNSLSVNWDDHNDEIISITFPDWIEKI